MREIKFRLWSKVAQCIIEWEEVKQKPHTIFDASNWIPMQFTDSTVNGKELYEGDIVRCYSSEDWHSKFDYLLEIKWCDFDKGNDTYSGTKGWGAFRVGSGFASTGLSHIKNSYAGVNFEIIGNIHKNTELIINSSK